MSLPLLTTEPAYQKLQQYFNENGQKINIKNLFENDPARFEKYRWEEKIDNRSIGVEAVKFHWSIRKGTWYWK